MPLWAGIGAIAGVIGIIVLTPSIVGGKLALHPMLVFIALILAGDLYGLLGLVLAIPASAVLRVFVRLFDELYLRSDLYLPPAVSPSGRIEQTSTARRRLERRLNPSGTFHMDLGDTPAREGHS